MIDFTTAFAKRTIERLHFKARQNVNYLHDVVFLSSYLHDGTLSVADITFRKGVVRMLRDRDCWEFYNRIHRNKYQLLGCPSILTISGVRSLRWSRKKFPKTVEITKVFVGEKQFLDDIAHLVFHCPAQNVRLDLLGDDWCFEIELVDLVDPK